MAAYLHGAKIGVLVDLAGGEEQVGKDVAMHIAASKPICVSKEQVPAENLETERRIYTEQAAQSGKPADIVAKLNKAVNETMGAKSMESNLESDGLTASPGTAADFGAQLASESARWGAIVKKRNIKAE